MITLGTPSDSGFLRAIQTTGDKSKVGHERADQSNSTDLLSLVFGEIFSRSSNERTALVLSDNVLFQAFQRTIFQARCR